MGVATGQGLLKLMMIKKLYPLTIAVAMVAALR